MRILLPSLFMIAVCSARADDLSPLSDEFDNPATFANWSDLGVVEGWQIPSYQVSDIDTTEPGHFHIVPGANTWYNNLRGLLWFKEITGDFVVSARVRILSRHNPGDPTEVPNRSFSLSGIFIHAPRTIVQAAPDPYTTAPVWPPELNGSDYVPNTENYIFLSYGTAGAPNTRQFEIKATRNSVSELYFDSTGINQSATEAWLQLVRVGNTVVCLRRHDAAADWIVENRYPNADHPFPVFGETLQVGITAYTDWETAMNSWQNIEEAWHFNYAPPATGSPDLISQVDYFRFRRPHPALTEAVLQGMNVSYDPAANASANPPVELAASPAAATYLGDFANHPYQPFADWQLDQFGEDAGLEIALPGSDPDFDGLANLMEFVLGGDAEENSSHRLPTFTREPGGSVFSFFPAVENGAWLEIQSSSGLSGWAPVGARALRGGDWMVVDAAFSLEVDPSSGAVRVGVPDDGETRFLRLSASLDP